jgi:hydrogenase-4 component B
MQVGIALWGVAVLLGTAVAAALLQRSRLATALTYGISLFACLGILGAGCHYLAVTAAPPQTLRLPFGLPWTGSHLRLDALSAFFLLVVNLGGLPPASLPSAMVGTRQRRAVSSPSIPCLLPA